MQVYCELIKQPYPISMRTSIIGIEKSMKIYAGILYDGLVDSVILPAGLIDDLLSTLDKVEIEYTPKIYLIIRTSVFNCSVLLWKMRRMSLLRNTSNPISSIRLI